MRSAIAVLLTAGAVAVAPATARAQAIDVSLNPPGGLSPANTPQMVLVTFDDSVSSGIETLVQAMTSGRTNPGGGGLQFTFFVSTDWTDYTILNRLYSVGHEIAVHTMTHTTGTATDEATWRAEIVGARAALCRLANIPPRHIAGFRAPYLKYNNATYRILSEQGFLYDASITEAPGEGSLSLDAGHMIWPYTLHDGVKQNTWTGIRPTDTFLDLFEIPVWSQLNASGHVVAPMDPGGSDAEVLNLLQYNFTARYSGNRAPMGLFLHGGSWTSRSAVLGQFIDWALAHPGTWFVSMRAAADYALNPCGLAGAEAFPPFLTRTCPPHPEADYIATSFSKGTVRACGVRPPNYPDPANVFLCYEPLAGGHASLDITGLWTTGFNAKLSVANDTAEAAADWQVELELNGGEVTWVSGVAWSRSGSTIILRPSQADGIGSGGTLSISLGGTRSAEIDATTQTTMYGVQTLRPTIYAALATVAGLEMEWTESAYGYVVEHADSLHGPWTPAAVVRGRPAWSTAIEPNPTFRVYRIRGTD